MKQGTCVGNIGKCKSEQFVAALLGKAGSGWPKYVAHGSFSMVLLHGEQPSLLSLILVYGTGCAGEHACFVLVPIQRE